MVLGAALGLGQQRDIVGMNWLKSVALNLSQRIWPGQGEGLLFLLAHGGGNACSVFVLS